MKKKRKHVLEAWDLAVDHSTELEQLLLVHPCSDPEQCFGYNNIIYFVGII
jgi:hypothetical protein